MPHVFETYVVKPGDSLSLIAQKHLGSTSRWKEIHKVNPSIKNPNRIYPGNHIFLPDHEVPVAKIPTKKDTAELKKAETSIEPLSPREQMILEKNDPHQLNFVTGLLSSIDRERAGDHLLAGLSAVKSTKRLVEYKAQILVKDMIEEIKVLRLSKKTFNSSQAYNEVLAIIARYQKFFDRNVKEILRDRLGGVYATRDLRKYVKGVLEQIPEPYTAALKQTKETIKKLEWGGVALFAVDTYDAISDCVEDFKDLGDKQECTSELMGFGAGNLAGSVTALVVASTNPGGWLIIGGTLLVTGISIGGSFYGKKLGNWIYNFTMETK